MIRVALKGMAGRKPRAALTALAIVLGVAMVSGTYVFTDSAERAIDTLLTGAYTGSDAVISGKDVVESSTGGDATVSAGLEDHLERLPSVEAASGGIVDFARLLDKQGEPISDHEAALGLGIEASDEQFNPLTLTEGRWPSGSQEIAIDAGSAAREDFSMGDTISVAARGPVRQFTISGIAEFGALDSLGALTLAVFDIPTAQAYFGKADRFDEIYVDAKEGVSATALVSEIEPLLPPNAEVATGEAQTKSEAEGSNEDLRLLQRLLLVFGGIALFVGAFVIFNTLSITVAQRTREFATLRTLGASRRQVLGSVVLESLVIGALASAIGLFAGLGLAAGLNALFTSLGVELPQTGTVLATRTVVVSLLVGVLITLFAGLFPALRATSVPPIAAVREGATLPRSRLAPLAPYIAIATMALGVAALAAGMFAPGLDATTVLVLLALGCLVLFLGIALISSRLVKPLASILGWPARRTAGVAGRLARDNSIRNPGRTAVTASALMIGVALVTFVAVLGEGLRGSVRDAVDRVVQADYVLTADDGTSPVTPNAAAALASAPGVQAVSGVRQDSARAFGSDTSVGGIDPATITEVVGFDWKDGSDATFAELGATGAVLQSEFASDHDLRVGSSFSLETPQGKKVELTVEGIYTPPKFDPILAPISLSQAAFASFFERPQDVLAFVDVSGESSAERTKGLEQALGGFPGAELKTKSEFITSRQKEIRDTLDLLYVLLALSVVVSLFGMVNTLALSVFERTRELGMLRAVGMTRRQARRMIRHEGIITALIGATLGLPLGMFLAALVTLGLEDEGVGFSVPTGTLVVFAVIAIVAGVFAAIFPARRASRLNVLEALQYE
jgi:putative ABC transport system permease protein